MAPKSLSQKLPVLREIPLYARFGARSAAIRAEDGFEVHLRRHNRAALGSLVGSDDALALQGVYDPAGPGVPDPETPLYGAHRGLLRRHHEARRLRQELILRLIGLFGIPFGLRDLLDVARLGASLLACLDGRGDNALDLGLGDKGPLYARGPQSRDRLEEHVAHAEQGLGAHRVQYHPTVHLARDGEGDPARDVGFDHPGYHVDAGTLGGDDEVQAHRPGLLGDPDHGVLHFYRGLHHEVCELVYDDDHVRHRLLAAHVVALERARPI